MWTPVSDLYTCFNDLPPHPMFYYQGHVWEFGRRGTWNHRQRWRHEAELHRTDGAEARATPNDRVLLWGKAPSIFNHRKALWSYLTSTPLVVHGSLRGGGGHRFGLLRVTSGIAFSITGQHNDRSAPHLYCDSIRCHVSCPRHDIRMWQHYKRASLWWFEMLKKRRISQTNKQTNKKQHPRMQCSKLLRCRANNTCYVLFSDDI